MPCHDSRTWIRLHRWATLFMTLFLVVAGVTSTIIAFYDDLDRWLNWGSTLSVLALIPVYAVVGRNTALIPLLLLAATLTAARLIAWEPWRVVDEPMLWILHLGYAWIPAGLIILAAHLLDAEFPRSVGIHALMVGAMSSLILGMMARVAAGLAVEPQWLLSAAALLWCLAFLVYAIEYTPILLHRRIDAA